MFTITMYDFFEHYFDFSLNGNLLNDLIYCIFGIGLIEETVKIIPFLFLLRFKSIINESVDYIVYASIAGLGFAFTENLLYFHESGLDSIFPRAFITSVLHMALTSFIAYGLLISDYKYKYVKTSVRVKYFFYAFLVACLIHGLYDFFLISEDMKGFAILSMCILIFSISAYVVITNNALNQSEFYDSNLKEISMLKYLLIGFNVILIYHYLVIALKFGAKNANLGLLLMSLSSMIFIAVVIVTLSNHQLQKGKWTNIRDIYSDK